MNNWENPDIPEADKLPGAHTNEPKGRETGRQTRKQTYGKSFLGALVVLSESRGVAGVQADDPWCCRLGPTVITEVRR